jgi:hypothetical protein
MIVGALAALADSRLLAGLTEQVTGVGQAWGWPEVMSEHEPSGTDG